MAIIYDNNFEKPNAQKGWNLRQEETKKFFNALRQKLEEEDLEDELEEEDYESGTGFGS